MKIPIDLFGNSGVIVTESEESKYGIFFYFWEGKWKRKTLVIQNVARDRTTKRWNFHRRKRLASEKPTSNVIMGGRLLLENARESVEVIQQLCGLNLERPERITDVQEEAPIREEAANKKEYTEQDIMDYY